MPNRKIVTAKLIKHKTDDGLVEMKDDIPLGKIYEVDLNSIQTGHGFNMVKRIKWEREVIYAKDGNEWLWFPTELLDIWGNKQ